MKDVGRARPWVATVLVAWLGLASAHAYLETASPEAYGMWTASAGPIVLGFSMAVEIGFSRFELVRLPDGFAGGGSRGVDVAERGGLDALARQHLARAAPDDRLPLTVTPPRGRAERLQLRADERIGPGAFLLAYRVLAVDGHVTEGLLVFFVGDE